MCVRAVKALSTSSMAFFREAAAKTVTGAALVWAVAGRPGRANIRARSARPARRVQDRSIVMGSLSMGYVVAEHNAVCEVGRRVKSKDGST
jgi:hypothetical protein